MSLRAGLTAGLWGLDSTANVTVQSSDASASIALPGDTMGAALATGGCPDHESFGTR
jgi:hypothetical protein